MADRVLALHLNQEHQSHLLAHILTYQFRLALNPTAHRNKASQDILYEVLYRLFQFCKSESEEGIFLLSVEEGQIIKEMLSVLQPLYEHWTITETYTLALEGLFACRVLLREAEQQASTQTESS